MLLRDNPRDRPQAIIVGTPTFGRVSYYWHQAMMELFRSGKPMNRALIERGVKGSEVGAARNLLVEYALALGERDDEPRVTHVLFVDDDVIFPPRALIRLLGHGLPIVSGLYYAKTSEPQPLMLSGEYQGLVTSWGAGEIVDCYAHGMGCTLIAREVFEAIEPPWFQTTQGELVTSTEFKQQTEDVFFCEKAARAGYQPRVDTGLLCLHYDYVEDTGYPAEAWQQYLRGEEPVAA